MLLGFAGLGFMGYRKAKSGPRSARRVACYPRDRAVEPVRRDRSRECPRTGCGAGESLRPHSSHSHRSAARGRCATPVPPSPRTPRSDRTAPSRVSRGRKCREPLCGERVTDPPFRSRQAATRVARLAREAGVGQFIHVSGIGADAGSASRHPQPRERRKSCREAFPATTLIRPSIMFGRGDAFLIPIARGVRAVSRLPAIRTWPDAAQPAYVGDVADAIARVMQNAQSSVCYELGGQRVSPTVRCSK